MNRYLHHVTLTTGHSRRSYRDEVDDEAVAVCRRILDDALAAPRRHVEIPACYGCTLTATAEGGALIATVWGPPTEVRTLGLERPPLVTFGVAERSRHGVKLWRVLHQAQGANVQTSPEQRPPEPWVAARIEIGIALLGDQAEVIMPIIGDLERCLAWAWIERGIML